MGALVVLIAAVVIVGALVTLASIKVIGPTEVGLVTKRFGVQASSPKDNPIAFNGRGRLSGRPAHAGSAVQAVADLRGEEVPVGAGTGGRDRRRDRPGRPSAADRREERRLQARVRQLLEISERSSTAAAKRVCSARCCPRARCVPIHPVAFLVLTVAPGVRPARRSGPRRRAPATGGV